MFFLSSPESNFFPTALCAVQFTLFSTARTSFNCAYFSMFRKIFQFILYCLWLCRIFVVFAAAVAAWGAVCYFDCSIAFDSIYILLSSLLFDHELEKLVACSYTICVTHAFIFNEQHQHSLWFLLLFLFHAFSVRSFVHSLVQFHLFSFTCSATLKHQFICHRHLLFRCLFLCKFSIDSRLFSGYCSM